jgi:hypothetical protein
MKQLKQRRSTPRHEIPEGWTTKFRVVQAPSGVGWRDARLLDLTEVSAAIEPYGLEPDETLTGTLELNILAPGGCPTGVLLRGTLKHATVTPNGNVRVGVSFLGLDSRKANFLKLLDQLAHAHSTRRPAACRPR